MSLFLASRVCMLGWEESPCVSHYLILAGISAGRQKRQITCWIWQAHVSNKHWPEVFSLIKASFYTNYSNNSYIQNGTKPLGSAVSIGAFRKTTSYVMKEKLLKNPFRNTYNSLWILYENILQLTVNWASSKKAWWTDYNKISSDEKLCRLLLASIGK